MLLTKQAILDSDDIHTAVVDMPEWGGEIKIKSLSVGVQLQIQDYLEKEENKNNAAFIWIVKSCVDENNKLIFDESDINLLKDKSTSSILKLFDEILAINNQNEKDVDKLAKNS